MSPSHFVSIPSVPKVVDGNDKHVRELIGLSLLEMEVSAAAVVIIISKGNST